VKLSLNRSTISPRASEAEVIQAAHAAGFPYVEMSARRLRSAVDGDRRVRQLFDSKEIVPMHGGWSIRLSWDRERFDGALLQISEEMAYVAQLGSRSGALVLPRKTPEDRQALPSRGELVDRIRQVAILAAAHALDLVIEFNGLHSGHPASCGFRTLRETLEIVGDTELRNVGVLLDSYHWHASGATTTEIAALPDAIPMYVHLNDAPFLAREVLEDSMRVLPGEGSIDLTGFLRSLRQRGYSGPAAIELKSPNLHARSPYEAAQMAYLAGCRVLGVVR
jgi:sugar phosphate isomerase/epimerase